MRPVCHEASRPGNKSILPLLFAWALLPLPGRASAGDARGAPPASPISEPESRSRSSGSAAAQEAERAQAARLLAEADRLDLRYERQAGLEAIASYSQALEIWRRLGDLERAARAARALAIVHQRMGDLESAVERYRESLRLSRAAAEPGLESEILADLGLARTLQGEPERGAEHCRQALGVARESGSARGEAAARNCLGEVDYHHGLLAGAADSHRRALSLWRALADRQGRARTLLLLGTIYSDSSEFARARQHYEAAMALWRQIGDRHGIALTLVAEGRLADRLGEYQSALNKFREALELIESMGDPLWQAGVLEGTASVYRSMGELETASAYWERSLERYRAAGVRIAELDVLLSVGEMNLAAGELGPALDRFQQALALSELLDNPRLRASALRFLGLTHRALGDSGEALTLLRRALAAQREDEDRRFAAYIRSDVGTVLLDRGELEPAREQFERALEDSRAARDRLGEATALYRLARTLRQQGELAAALERVEESLRMAESLRSSVASHALRSAYLASVHPRYELHVELLMGLHGLGAGERLAARALEASERARARTLLESLIEAGVDLRRGVDPDLLGEERRQERLLEAGAERLMRLASSGAGDEEIGALEAEIDELAKRADRLQAEIRSKSPHYAALTRPRPMTLEAIQGKVLDDDTLLLEYALGEERSFLWVVSSHGYASYELAPRQELERAARDVYGLLTARLVRRQESLSDYRRRVLAADGRYWIAARRLSEMLIAPAAGQLAGKRLLIVADGALQYVPFAALPVPGSSGEPIPLVVEHEVVSLPSASALAVLREETEGRKIPPVSVAVLADPVFEPDDPRLLAALDGSDAPTQEASASPEPSHGLQRALRQVGFLADGRLDVPRLLATRREANAIVAVAPAGASLKAIDFAASREMAMSPELGRYRIVHFATHGLVNSENPGLSGVMLSMMDEHGRPQNGFLGLRDIYNLELPVELVVLSACNTALGKEVRGEGLVGLVRGFMYAGARRVVASLWKVDDEATLELMRRFYRRMLEEGRSPAAALRQAQVAMWRQKPWRAPFFWAAFVLQGEWR
jgi:CHAT domain-containing protein/Tfp pilus assembly protein PilF